MNPYSPLRIYVAARWDDRDDALRLKAAIEANGMICTSTWLTSHDTQSMDALKAATNVVLASRPKARKDFDDIDVSDILYLYSPKKSHRNGTGGKHVETGYAMAKGKTVVVHGERENIFHYGPMVRVVGSFEEFLKIMEIPNV